MSPEVAVFIEPHIVLVETDGHVLTEVGPGVYSFTMRNTETQQTLTTTCVAPKLSQTTGTAITTHWLQQLTRAAKELLGNPEVRP